MEKAEVLMILKAIKRAYPMFTIPEDRQSVIELVNDWSDFLSVTSYQTANENLRRYIMNPDNRFPPHPGALAKTLLTTAERYHEQMRDAGDMTIYEWEMMRERAVPPTPEQRERVKKFVSRV